jgi:hypothetical protein
VEHFMEGAVLRCATHDGGTIAHGRGWGQAMTLITSGIVLLIGMALSQRCKVLTIFLATGLIALGIVIFGISHRDSVGSLALTMAVVASALQAGYLAGLVAMQQSPHSVCRNTRRL